MKDLSFKRAYSIFTFIMLSHVSSAQLITITHRDSDDGSKKLTKDDSLHIHPFSISNAGKILEFTRKDNIDFELINSTQLKQICSKNNYTWVFIQSSWCGACVTYLKKNIKIADSLKNEGVKLVVINQDIQIKQLQKKILMQKYHVLSYIIDPGEYGTNESKKQEQFVMEMANHKMLENYNSGSVPKNLFFDRNGNLIYYDTTYKISTDLIRLKVFN